MDSNNRSTLPVPSRSAALPPSIRKVGELLAGSPAGNILVRSARGVEQRLLTHLRDRLDQLESPSAANGRSPSTRHIGSLMEKPVDRHLNELKAKALDQSQLSASESLLRQIAFQLVPDEVRLIGALSDQQPRAVSHLESCTRLGGRRRLVQPYLSRLGKEAGIMLPRAPHYLRHLDGLGLLVFGDEDPSQTKAYEMLENGLDVRDSFDRIEQTPGLHPRFRRETVRLSDLGQEIWHAADSADVTD